MNEIKSKSRKDKSARYLIGTLVILTGGLITGLSAGFIPFDSSNLQVPLWIVGMSGLVFIIGGAMVFIGMDNRLNELLAFLMLFFMGSIGVWVSIFGDEDKFSGGFPFLPNEFNIVAGRVLFGLGALICLCLSFYAFYRFRKQGGSVE